MEISDSDMSVLKLQGPRTYPRKCILGILLVLDCVGLCDLRYIRQGIMKHESKGRTTLKTDFFEDSCSSPAMISSSRI